MSQQRAYRGKTYISCEGVTVKHEYYDILKRHLLVINPCLVIEGVLKQKLMERNFENVQ